MAKLKTTKDVILEFKATHGSRYNYSETEYVNKRTKVCIICQRHGKFWQRPDSHRNGCGCRKCDGDNKRFNTEKFIKKASAVHNNKYDYSKVEYTRSNRKVVIICPIHGEFSQRANRHLLGSGCIKCAFNDSGNGRKYDNEKFISIAKTVHGNRYDYSNVEYGNSNTKVCISCPEHGEFWQIASWHCNGGNCPRCVEDRKKYTLKDFILKSNATHNSKYDYSNSIYTNSKEKISITCPKHGAFQQTPASHMRGCGCPDCDIDYSDTSYIHYLYELTNTLDGCIYIGIHSTKDINDGYMGSGRLLNEVKNENGLELFEKKILKYYKNRREALNAERNIVDAVFVQRTDTYNLCIGG